MTGPDLPTSSRVYPWLTIHPDGGMGVDIAETTIVEADRRLVIMQELRAGRVVLAEPTDEMIERAGRAIHGHACGCAHEPWPLNANYREMARAALEAALSTTRPSEEG